MFRRRRRDRDSLCDRPTFQGEEDRKDSLSNARKPAGVTFDLLPIVRDGNGLIIQGSTAPEAMQKPRLPAPAPETTTPFVSFIHFQDVIDLNPASPSDTCPPTPALVYTAGGKAKSMYSPARPASVRKFRGSTLSQPGTNAIPSCRIPPVPALKLPSVKARHKQIPTFNVCIAGAPATGKTSFIRLLCETLDLDVQKDTNKMSLATVRDASYGKSACSLEDSVLSIIVNTAFDQRIRLTLHEAEAFAFSTDTSLNLQSDLKAQDLLRFIEDRMDASIVQESALVRQPLTSTDSHIHLCLYFLDQTCFSLDSACSPTLKGDSEPSTHGKVFPHHLNIIKQLSKRVNVIPVIARADEFTIAQLATVKAALRALSTDRIVMDPTSFTQAGSHADEGYRSIGRLASGVQSDSEDDTEEDIPITPVIRSRSNSVHKLPARRRNKRFSEIAIKPSEEDINAIFPPSLVSPDTFDALLDNYKSRKRFERRFRYGTVDVENEDHCEFVGLKRVLFTTGWKTLKEMTEDKFEDFRTERLQERQARSCIRTLASN